MGYYKKDDNGSGLACGCYIVLILFNAIVGGYAVDFILNFFGKQIPFWGSMLIGLFTAELSVPAGIIIRLLQYFGVL